MDVSSLESPSYRAPAAPPADFVSVAAQEHEFPDFSIKQLIARLILARSAVVRATNPLLADEYLKFARVFDSSKPGIAHRLNTWTKA